MRKNRKKANVKATYKKRMKKAGRPLKNPIKNQMREEPENKYVPVQGESRFDVAMLQEELQKAILQMEKEGKAERIIK